MNTTNTANRIAAVDLFAGWGGFTEGAEQAGVSVRWAANHWPLAVEAHAANHPNAAHVCQDLRQADWSQLPDFDLLLAAPACQGHSQAAQPSRARSERTRRYHDALRATAMAVVDCADITNPEAIVVENVPDFARWRLFAWWVQGLERLGYHVSQHRIRASHHGVPQRRDRLFVVASKRAGFTYERPVHAVEPAFGPCIDWSAGDWKPIERATGAARDRLEAGLRKHGGGRFFGQHVSISTGAQAATGLALDEPIRTITTKDQWFACDGERYRPLTVRENARAMGFGDHYRWPSSNRKDAIRGLGNAVCPPVARAIVEQVSAHM